MAAGMGTQQEGSAMKTRARVSAWLVFIGMAGTTMSFQVLPLGRASGTSLMANWPISCSEYRGLKAVGPSQVGASRGGFVSGWEERPEMGAAHPPT